MRHVKKWLAIAVSYLFRCFPIKHNKILFFSYYGSQYGCNPKYISEYIAAHYPEGKFDVVWAFSDPGAKQIPKQFRVVRMLTLRYFYELSTAKIIITNYRMTDLFIKRKHQYYIQTWHSSLRLKQIEKDAEDVLPAKYVDMAKKDSQKCDLLLSGCQYSTEIFRRAFWYEGDIFEHGTPRNDGLFQRDMRTRADVLDKLDIKQETSVLLYAPTFRKTSNSNAYKLNWTEITQRLENKFGGDWMILVKLHPHVASESNQLAFTKNVMNVSRHDDIQELLMSADILISDYSSLIFDFSITKRPCFLYVYDVDDYINQERKLYFDIENLPFISAGNNNELLDKINDFNEKAYRSDLEVFLKQVGTYEEGNANASLLHRIEEVCFKQRGSSVYEKEAV